MNLMKKIRNPWAVAVTSAKKMGFKRFTEGSPGREKRGEIAEALKRESRKSLDYLIGWLQKEHGIVIKEKPWWPDVKTKEGKTKKFEVTPPPIARRTSMEGRRRYA